MTDYSSVNCIFQNLPIIQYFTYVTFSIENMKGVFCSHGKTGRDTFSCLFLPSFIVLHMMHFLGTIQAFSSNEISPVVLKWDMAEAQCKSCSPPMHQRGLVTSHQVSKVHPPPSVGTRFHGLSGPTQSFISGLSQIPINCPYFYIFT